MKIRLINFIGLITLGMMMSFTHLSYAKDFVFSVSWQPAFCETMSHKPECRTAAPTRFDAANFTLHGLWPQSGDFCGVPPEIKQADKKGDWRGLPPVRLSEVASAELKEKMPGTASFLERHEWIKHGTCAETSQEQYFKTALQLLDHVNHSSLQKLVSAKVGKAVTLKDLRSASESDYGNVSKEAVEFLCSTIDNKQALDEIRFHLRTKSGLPAEISANTLAKPVRPTPENQLCDKGSVFIDAAGQ